MDTPRYRIGNDLTIFWAINNRDGSPYDLDGKEVRLFMTHERGREEVEVQITQLEPGIRNNVIRWDFKAEDQRILGKYTLTFVVLESDTHRELTKDYGEAFTLVGRSEMENEEGDANISTGGDLILSTKLDIYRIQATNVDVAGLKNQIYDVEKGLTTKVERKEFDEKTGEFENAFVKVETSIKGINTEIKDTSGEITQIKQSIDGIEVSVGDLEYKVESLEKQTDGAIEKWFYPGAPGPDVLPESNWKTEQEKYSHLGDLYYDEDSGIAYRYITKDNQYLWVVIEDADIVAALEAAKNNNRTFLDQPKTPYKVGDLWIAEKNYEESGIKQDDIVVCVITREEGQFDINDWQKKGNAINDEDLENFVDKYYEEVILPEIGKQIDGQAASYYGPDDPSLEWEAGTEADHKGDLWFNTNNNQANYWSGSEWVENEVPEEVFDKIDGKNTIFVSIPEGKDYKENDLWFVEKDYNLDGFEHRKGVILVALEDALFDEATQSYQFKYADWVRRDTYTDDTAVANLDEYIKTGFKNGILDEGEKGAIESAWDSIVLAQDQLTQDYQTVILPGYTLPEYTDLQKAYKAVYNDQPSTEYPNLGTFQLLENAVTAILNYVVTEEESTLPALIEAYDNAYDAYRTALSNYTIAYGKFTNAIRAELGQANEYIEAIIDDGKLTPIEKKQLVEVYKSLAAEYSSNVDAAFTAKIWKYNDAGNEVPGAYAGPKGVGQDYFDTYVAYKDAYSPILAVFTGSDWGFDKMDETTTFGGSVNLSQLDAYFDAYYEALRAIARVISAVAEEKAEASLAMKEYMDDLEEVLTPTEAITQVGKGVVLSSIIGVGTYDEQTGKYLLKAGMNATAKNTADLITIGEHGRIVFVGGANGKTDWNEATFVVYEDGYVRFRAGKIDQDVQIGDAIIQSVIADEINLLSYPEYDEATGKTKLTPLFSVNTEKDSNGRDKIVSISALYDMYIGGNLIVRGDTSSTAKGTDSGTDGTLIGVVVNGTQYKDETNGMLDLSTLMNQYATTEWINGKKFATISDLSSAIGPLSGRVATLESAGYITSAALNGYAKTSDLPTKSSLGLGNVENKSSATIRGEITSSNVTNALGYTPANNASLANYLPLSGGTITGNLGLTGCLHISQPADYSYDQGIRINSSPSQAVSALWLCTKNASGYDAGMWGITASATGNLRFRGGASSLADFMNISQSGNVGIGTTSPAYKLDVLSDNFACLRLQRNQSNNSYGAAMVFGNTLGNFGAIGWNKIDDFFISNASTSASSNAIMRGSHTALTIYPAVTMSSTLSVGGNISPKTNNDLHIGTYASASFGFINANVHSSGAAANNLWLVAGSSTDATGIQFARNNNGTSTGKIGTWDATGLYPATNNAYTLGKSSYQWSTVYGVNGIFSGDTSSGSDIRFKDKITDHCIALSDIAEAPLFTFRWNDREDDSVHLGSSAQYWEKVAPWLVKGEDFKTLDYSTLGVAIGISLANKTINLEERIKILEDKVKALEAENRRLRYGIR